MSSKDNLSTDSFLRVYYLKWHLGSGQSICQGMRSRVWVFSGITSRQAPWRGMSSPSSLPSAWWAWTQSSMGFWRGTWTMYSLVSVQESIEGSRYSYFIKKNCLHLFNTIYFHHRTVWNWPSILLPLSALLLAQHCGSSFRYVCYFTFLDAFSWEG